MSTFGGKIEEIPHISVDRFNGKNLESEAYFLSHCHADHMVGLSCFDFYENLKNNNKYLYVTDVSCTILKKLFPQLENNLKVLDVYSPTLIELKGGNVSVLPIPAGHCPGSVMFLFETNVRVLYTGDYRINKRDIEKVKSFYDSFKRVKEIDKVYLDTTFFLKRFQSFPKRDESLEELCNLIKDWIDTGDKYRVKLLTSAKYGYEYLFMEIYNKIKQPIHVNKDAFNFYSLIPEMDNSVTLDGTKTQIHCNCGSYFRQICDEAYSSEKLRTIKVSAFKWTQDALEDGFSSASSNMSYVCYSTHASYEEGVALLKFLKPKSFEICVEHDDSATNLEIRNLIDEVLEECKPKETEGSKFKLFESEESIVEESSVCDDFDYGLLDSPPRNSRRLRKKLRVESTRKSVSDNTEPFNLEDGSSTIQSGSTETDNNSFIEWLVG